jgi:hypothetical protein
MTNETGLSAPDQATKARFRKSPLAVGEQPGMPDQRNWFHRLAH